MPRPLPIVSALVLLLGQSGCAVMVPYVGASDRELVGNQVSLAKAVEYAEHTRNAYENGLRSYAVMNRITGFLMLSFTGAAATLGILGTGSEVVAGLGAGGATLFGMNRLLHNQNRLELYARGAEAIGCILDKYALERGFDIERLEQLNREIASGSRHLEARLAALVAEPGITTATWYQSALETVGRAWKVQLRGERLRAVGPRLYDDVERVRASVNLALLANEPDLAEVAAAQRRQIAAHARLFVEPPSGIIREDARAETAPPARLVDDMRQVQRETAALEALVREFDRLSDGFDPEQVDKDVEACFFSPEKAGLLFRTRPPDALVIDLAAAAPKGEIVAMGGKAPYHARWTSNAPGPKVVLAPVNHDTGTSGHGIVTITAERDAPEDTYSLLITEQGGRSVTLLVSLAREGAAAAREGTPAERAADAGAQTAPDPQRVKAIQGRLVELGCLASGEVGTEGEWGTSTQTAAEKLTGASGGDFEATYGAIEAEGFLEKIEQALDQAGENNPCKPSTQEPGQG